MTGKRLMPWLTVHSSQSTVKTVTGNELRVDKGQGSRVKDSDGLQVTSDEHCKLMLMDRYELIAALKEVLEQSQ